MSTEALSTMQFTLHRAHPETGEMTSRNVTHSNDDEALIAWTKIRRYVEGQK